MALIGNRTRFTGQAPIKALASPSLVKLPPKHGELRGFWAGEATVVSGASVANTQSIPGGYRSPGAWVLAPKNGGISSRRQINGAGEVGALNLQGGLYGDAAITGVGTVAVDAIGLGEVLAAIAGTASVVAPANALGALAAALSGDGNITSAPASSVITGAAALVGSGDIADAALGLIVTALADLSGSASVSADMSSVIVAACAITGSCSLSPEAYGAMVTTANLAGSGDVVAAIQALATIVAGLTGAGTVAVGASAPATMSADIAATGDVLTTQSIAAAVWNALAAQFAAAGTMGEAVQGGGGALSPTQATMLRELYELMGLDPTKPLVVDDTGNTRRVPADGSSIDQTVVTSGGETTVTRV